MLPIKLLPTLNLQGNAFRKHHRRYERIMEKRIGADDRVAAAEAKRERRKAHRAEIAARNS